MKKISLSEYKAKDLDIQLIIYEDDNGEEVIEFNDLIKSLVHTYAGEEAKLIKSSLFDSAQSNRYTFKRFTRYPL